MAKWLAVVTVIGMLMGGWAAAGFAESGSEPQATPTAPPEMWTRPADAMVMVLVPAGELQMGSTAKEIDQALHECNRTVGNCGRVWFEDESPAHTVALDAFWLDLTEVTNAQYRRCVEAGDCQAPEYADDSRFNGDEQPVVGVSQGAAVAYCEWAGARLLTEAEWEYAARGPEGWMYPWGNEFDGAKLNFCDKNCEFDWADKVIDDGYGYTAPVGSYPGGMSWCGALDLAGNVWEWVADWYGPYLSDRQVNPSGPASGEGMVLRGGSWNDASIVASGAYRHWGGPVYMSNIVGFRCARNP